MPFYPVTQRGSKHPAIVRAPNSAQALRHVCNGEFVVGDPLSPDELSAHYEKGGIVLKAGGTEEIGGSQEEG